MMRIIECSKGPNYLHVSVQGKVLGDVGEGEIVARQLGFGHIERHLIAGQPSQVSADGRAMDCRATVQVNVGVDGGRVVLELCLD